MNHNWNSQWWQAIEAELQSTVPGGKQNIKLYWKAELINSFLLSNSWCLSCLEPYMLYTSKFQFLKNDHISQHVIN